jgi:hypothetical protein
MKWGAVVVICAVLGVVWGEAGSAEEKGGAGGGAGGGVGGGEVGLTRRLKFSTCYVREKVDGVWHMRVVGSVPRPPGLFVIVFNEAGEIVRRGEIPTGAYTQEKPFLLDVPADGKAQQYVIKLVGQQDNYEGVELPMTDLPGEVYGDNNFALLYRLDRPDLHRQVAFQVPEGGEKFQVRAGGSHVRILDEKREVVADSRKDGSKGTDGSTMLLSAQLRAGRIYWLDFDVGNALYFGVTPGPVRVTFDPDRWFEPRLEWELEKRPWWKGVAR